MAQVIKDIVTWLKQWFYTEKEVDDIVEGLQTQINNKADTTTVSNLSTTVSGKANTSHAHGNLTSDGKVTNASNDTFEYFVGIGNSSNAVYKSQYLRADKLKDTSAHTNIGSSANDTQATINTKIDTALAGKQVSGNYATKSHTHTDNDISYTASKSNSVSTIDLATYEEFNANRLAFLKKENITIEYTTNANATTPTWTAFPSSRDNDKIKLVTTTANFIAGNNATASANNQVRVTLDAGGTYASPNDGSKQSDIYMVTRKILIFSSTGGGSNCKCKVETSTYNEPTTWTETGTYTVAGQSGWNTIPLYITWGGYSSQLTTRVRYIRLTFSTESAKNVSVSKIRMIGETLYTPTIDTNTLASNGHLYKVDESKNGIFPNYITATGYKVNNATGFLKADGTVDSTSYTTASGHTHSYLPLSGGTLTGNVVYPIESNSSSNTAAGNLVWGGSPDYNTDMWTTLRNQKSSISTISVPNDKWYNVISVRHRNGSGDGNNYGMYIKSALQNDDGLIWAKQKGASAFMAERTILDSSNYSTYANKTTIANNLTTSTAGSALDATQGKWLKDNCLQTTWTTIPATSNATIAQPYLRLFHFEDTGTSRSGHLIFEVSGRNNDKKYCKIRVDIRRESATSSSIKITPLEVMTIALSAFDFALYYDSNKTCLDIFKKVERYEDLAFRIYDKTTRQGTITQYSPGPNSTESYASVADAGTTLYNASYNSITNGGSYEITANKFIKSGGTTSQFLKANGDVDSNVYIHTAGTNLSKSNNTLNHATSGVGAKSSGLYKTTIDAQGHITAATAVEKADITGLGISASDHTHSYVPTANVKNDLTTGGASNVLSAEQGKTLQNNKVNKSNGVAEITDNNASAYTNIGTMSDGATQESINANINTKFGQKANSSHTHKTSWSDKTDYLSYVEGTVLEGYTRLMVNDNIGLAVFRFGGLWSSATANNIYYYPSQNPDANNYVAKPMIPSEYRPKVFVTGALNFPGSVRVNTNGVVSMTPGISWSYSDSQVKTVYGTCTWYYY